MAKLVKSFKITITYKKYKNNYYDNLSQNI